MSNSRNLIDEACTRVLRQEDAKLKKIYCQALLDSIEWNGTSTDLPVSGKNLAKRHSLNAEIMESHLIVIGKDSAYTFLQNLGFKTGETSFKKKLSASNYQSAFKRKPLDLGRKLLFTYSEILYFVDLGTGVTVSDEVKEAARGSS